MPLKYISIAISGPIASGTTTTAKILSQKLNLEHHSAGEFFRQYMQDHNIPLPNKEEIPDNIERELDQKLTTLMESKKPVIIDGLYAGYFARNMNHVLKVLITADEATRIRRALDRAQGETAQHVRRRDTAHNAKFRKLYANENFLDPKFFDLEIDNTQIAPEVTIEQICKKFLEN